ncbi:MAG: hypothetical protein NT154_19420 [Verrucomicrobia bacterium]|nr:hypothetical protein [Verrucomicrobiota bacterium]
MNRKTKPMPERSLPSRPGKPTGLQEARAAKAPGALRRAAEARLRGRPATHPPQNQDDPKRLWHELIVHQVELEMQNEELRRAQTEIESALGQYAGLYDFAPVGYLTLRPDSTIQKLNLSAA